MPECGDAEAHPGRRGMLAAGALLGIGLLAGCGGPMASTCYEGDVPADELPDTGFELPFGLPVETFQRREPQLIPGAIAVSPDGKTAVALEPPDRKFLDLSRTAGTTYWDVASGQIIERRDDWMSGALAWHPSGELLAVSSQERILLMSPDGQAQWTLGGHQESTRRVVREIRDLAFSPDGERLASLSTDRTVRLWSAAPGTCDPGRVLSWRHPPIALAFSPDSAVLGILLEDRGLVLHDGRTGEKLSPGPGEQVQGTAVACSAEGTFVVADEEMGTLRSVTVDGAVADGPALPTSCGQYAAAGPDGQVVFSGPGPDLALWTPGQTELQVLTPEVDDSAPSPITELGRPAIAPDGTLYVISRWQGILRFEGTSWGTFEMP